MLFALILLPFGGQGQRVLEPGNNVDISKESVKIIKPGFYYITGSDESSKRSITIDCDSEIPVDLFIENLTIKVDIYYVKNPSPIDIINGNVNLTLVGDNKLILTASRNPAIHVSENSSLTISAQNGGTLFAQGGRQAPGIGSGKTSEKVGKITIRGGNITAMGNEMAPGIGCTMFGSISNIIIEGGFITAISGDSFDITKYSSIGGFYNSPDGGEFIINGGTVLTYHHYRDAGYIGINNGNLPAKVIINDNSSVLFNPSVSKVTPVNSNGKEVNLKTISGLMPNSKVEYLDNDQLSKDLYVDDKGKLYFWWTSDHAKLDRIYTYDDNSKSNFEYFRQSLTVNKNGTSWDDHRITFTVMKDNKDNPIDCSDNNFYLEKGVYSLYANGDDISKSINIVDKSPDNVILDYYTVTYDLNEGDNNSSIPKQNNYLKGSNIPVDKNAIPTRKYYEFKGWGLTRGSMSNVEYINNIQAATTLYAIWIANEFSVKTVGKQELTYKKDMESLDLSTFLSTDAVKNCGDITFNIDNNSSLPAGLKLEGSTIKGVPEAVTKQDIITSITATAANTFSRQFNIEFSVAKANATIAKIEIPAEGYTYSGKAIEIAPPKVSGAASDNLDATLTYYTSYVDDQNNTKTTSADSGAEQEGGAPVYAGSYTVVASFAGNKNYNKAKDQSAAFDIKRKELTVTPVSNQIIYEGDEILYEVKDAVNGEIPVFDGALKVKEGIIIQDNDFKLKDSFSKNYSFKFTPDIGVTVHEGKASEAVATMNAEAGQNDWFTSNVTITPPADFKIELVPSNPVATLKSDESHKETLLWDTEGAHTLSYTLHRQSRSESYDHALSLKLDKTPPTLRATVDNENYTLTFSDGNAGSGIAKLLVDDKDVSISDTDASYAGTAPAGVHKAKAIDKAGLSYEIEFTLTKKPDNPDPNPGPKPDPDPGPKPTPTRYDVTLTDTTGIIYTPAAGKYKVDAWGKFDFSIEVAKGYTMFSDPIVYVNNVKLPSKDNKGNYSINPVREDKVVKVTGIVSDLSTANEAINAPDRRITVIGKTIYIDVPDRAVFHLFDITGSHKLSRQLHPGTNRIDVDPGSYIGRIDNEKEGKVIIVK